MKRELRAIRPQAEDRGTLRAPGAGSGEDGLPSIRQGLLALPTP